MASILAYITCQWYRNREYTPAGGRRDKYKNMRTMMAHLVQFWSRLEAISAQRMTPTLVALYTPLQCQ